MGILSRFKAIFQAQAHAVADQLENPKASLDFSLTKLEESYRQLSRSLIDVSAARRRLEVQRDQMAAAVTRYEGQAKAAVAAGRDDLARMALARQEETRVRQSELEAHVASLEQQVTNLKTSQLNLERKLTLFRSKKEELKSLYDASQAQLGVRESLSGISKDLADVGNTIQHAEARIQEMQSRADAIDQLVAEGVLSDVLEPGTDEIERELTRIGRNRAVDEALARLKAEAGATAG